MIFGHELWELRRQFGILLWSPFIFVLVVGNMSDHNVYSVHSVYSLYSLSASMASVEVLLTILVNANVINK